MDMPKFFWYTVAEASTLRELNEKAAKLLQDGWQPTGGIAIGKDSNGNQAFFQAFVLDRP